MAITCEIPERDITITQGKNAVFNAQGDYA